jgi:prevent-host-death family protein
VSKKLKDRNNFDAIYPISLLKRNLNSVMRKFESRDWSRVLITRNGKPVAEVIHPLTSEQKSGQLK